MLLDYLTIIIVCTVIGQVWVLLIQPEMLFDFMGQFIDLVKNKKLHKLLVCNVCLSGQLALWVYLGYCIHTSAYYSIITHLSIVACTIWLSAVQSKMFNL